jgi:hypothetical protein
LAFAAPGRTILRLVFGHHHAWYVVRRRVSAEQTAVPARHLAVIEGEGQVTVAADAPADVLFLAGEPITEPVVAWGPFVMSTRAEIVTAQQDFLAGRMGRLDGVPF